MLHASSSIHAVIRLVLVAILALGLTACGGDMDELDQYINKIKSEPGGRIEPLPEITPYEVFAYVADEQGIRSPFVPDTPQASGSAAGGTRPDPDRIREFLEDFPLDTLRMVGTLNIDSDGIGGYIERDAAVGLAD
jgi:type IV pilus assembly protein PilP